MPDVDLPKMNGTRWEMGMEIGGSRIKQKLQGCVFGCRALNSTQFIGLSWRDRIRVARYEQEYRTEGSKMPHKVSSLAYRKKLN